MSEYVQVGVTAERDVIKGTFEPGVPLYVKAEDVQKGETYKLASDIAKVFMGKMDGYRKIIKG